MTEREEVEERKRREEKRSEREGLERERKKKETPATVFTGCQLVWASQRSHTMTSLFRRSSSNGGSRSGSGPGELNNSRPPRQVRRLEFNQAMEDFKTMFPSMDYEVIECVLRSNSGAVDATIDQLLQMSIDGQGSDDSSDSDDSIPPEVSTPPQHSQHSYWGLSVLRHW